MSRDRPLLSRGRCPLLNTSAKVAFGRAPARGAETLAQVVGRGEVGKLLDEPENVLVAAELGSATLAVGEVAIDCFTPARAKVTRENSVEGVDAFLTVYHVTSCTP